MSENKWYVHQLGESYTEPTYGDYLVMGISILLSIVGIILLIIFDVTIG